MKKSELRQIIREEIEKFSYNEQEIAIYDPKLNKKKFISLEDLEKNHLISKNASESLYSIAEFPYTTPEGDTFDLSFIGVIFSSQQPSPSYKNIDFGWGFVDIYYEGKKLDTIYASRIGGVAVLITETINKVKKWLDKNGSKLIEDKKQYRKFDS